MCKNGTNISKFEFFDQLELARNKYIEQLIKVKELDEGIWTLLIEAQNPTIKFHSLPTDLLNRFIFVSKNTDWTDVGNSFGSLYGYLCKRFDNKLGAKYSELSDWMMTISLLFETLKSHQFENSRLLSSVDLERVFKVCCDSKVNYYSHISSKRTAKEKKYLDFIYELYDFTIPDLKNPDFKYEAFSCFLSKKETEKAMDLTSPFNLSSKAYLNFLEVRCLLSVFYGVRAQAYFFQKE